MSYKTCPEWPELMELAPDLQFKHMSVADAQLPFDVLSKVSHVSLGEVEICCDLDHHVYNGPTPMPQIGDAQRHPLVRGARVGDVRPRRLEPRGLTGAQAPSPGVGSRVWQRSSSPSDPAARAGSPLMFRSTLALAMLGRRPRGCGGACRSRAARDRRRLGRSRRPPTAASKSSPTRATVSTLRSSAGLNGDEDHCLVVNADLPCATPEALALLLAHAPAFVAAADGTTNALALPDPTWFRPLYGPGSAARFARANLARVSIPELEHDVDTLSDLLQI